MNWSKKSTYLVPTLAALSMLTALSVDIYLPAMTSIATTFQVSAKAVSISLSLFLISFSVGQLAYGPLSDRFGRLSTLKWGLLGYFLSSLLCLLSPSLNYFYLARTLQGMCACCGTVTAFALVGDLFDRDRAAKVTGYLGMGVALAPMLAPLLGAELSGVFGWRANFVFLALTSLGLLALCKLILPETKPASADRKPQSRVYYFTMLKHPEFRKYAIVNALAFSGLMSFISLSPFLFMTVGGATPTQFSRFFTSNAAMLLIGGYLVAKTSDRWGTLKSLRFGFALIGLGAVLMLLASQNSSPFALLLPAMVSTLGVSFLMAHSAAAALPIFKEATGAASALLGFLRFGTGGIVATAMAWITGSTSVPLGILLLACATIGWILLQSPTRRRRYREVTAALLC